MLSTASARPRLHARAHTLALMIGGIAALAASATALAVPTEGTDRRAFDPASGAGAITLVKEDVTVVTQVYEPGQDSGWHTHSGIHAVAVLSGVLTVYDGACRAGTVAPGQPYVGGHEVHRTRNETAEPVEMVVTYLASRTPTASTTQVPAPAC